MTLDRFYNDSAVPQLVIDPFTNELIEANLEACRLLHMDREHLKQSRPTRLFGATLPQLIVFTQEILDSGFQLINTHYLPQLKENYMLRFRKP